MASGKISSTTEILSSDSKEVVPLSASQVAGTGASSNFTTRDSRSERVMGGPSVPVASKSWQRIMLTMNSVFGKAF